MGCVRSYLLGFLVFALPPLVGLGQVIPFSFWKGASNSGWTWMGGDNTELLTGAYGTKGTASASNHPGAREIANFWRDSSTGNLWLFGGDTNDANGFVGRSNELWK